MSVHSAIRVLRRATGLAIDLTILEDLDQFHETELLTPCGVAPSGEASLDVTFHSQSVSVQRSAVTPAGVTYDLWFRLQEDTLVNANVVLSQGGQGDGGGSANVALEHADGTELWSVDDWSEPFPYEAVLPTGDYVLLLRCGYSTSNGGGAANFGGTLSFDQGAVSVEAPTLSDLKARF